jgi:hypothetical protein
MVGKPFHRRNGSGDFANLARLPHKAKTLLKSPSPPVPEYLDATVKYGPHKLTKECKDFLREKMLAKI